MYAVLLAAAVLPYLGGVAAAGFVWDDLSHIAGNPRLESLSAVAGYFRQLEGIYYRPAIFVSYAAEHAVWGRSPAGFHLTNVLLHALNTLFVFELALGTRVRRLAAACGAAIFALHPLQSEAVAYVSGRTDLLMTAAALAACGATLKALRSAAWRRCGWSVLAALAAIAAVLSKESGFALLLLLPCWAWRHRRHDTSYTAGAVVAPSLAVLVAALLLRPGGLPSALRQIEPSALVAAAATLLSYARLLLWPASLQVDRLVGLPTAGGLRAALVLVLLAAAALSLFAASRRGAVGDWAIWAVATYLPVSNLLPIYPAMAAAGAFAPEHNLYAPLAGLGVLAGICLERVALPSTDARARPRRWVVAAIALVLLAWGGRTAVRGSDWRDEATLFGAAAAAGSESPRVWFNLANVQLARGDAVAASASYRQSLARAPRDAEAWTNLAIALQRQGDYGGAGEAYARALEVDPGNAAIHENLGALHLARGEGALAVAAFRRALELDPTRSRSRAALRALGQ